MSRISDLLAPASVLLALTLGMALVAPPGCHERIDPEADRAAEGAPVAAEAGPATGDLAPAEPAPPDSAEESPRPDLPEGFVRLRDVAPRVGQEIRYATAFNFVGEPIDGYEAPECVLAEEAAEALGRVADDLARDGLGLKVYDCYRPQTAVDHFVRWIYTDDQAMKEVFYPEEAKNTLFRRGYIARRSGHSRGATVDLTLVRAPASASVVPASGLPVGGAAGRCDAARGERLDERDLDMGTAYDCFTPLAATDSRGVSAEARRNRDRLRQAMSRRGFRNYEKEWWHFTLRNEPHPGTYYDFPVE